MEQSETKRMEEYDLKGLDFGVCSLALGVKLPVDVPWLALDKVDLMLLHGLLTTRFQGAEKAPAEASDGLKLLAAWAEAGAEWMRKNGHD